MRQGLGAVGLGLVAVALVGLVFWLVMRGDDAAPAPAPTDPKSTAGAAPEIGSDAELQRAEVDARPARPDPAAKTATGPDEPAAETASPGAPGAMLRIEVRDRADNAPLPEFGYTITSLGTRLTDSGTAGSAIVTVEPEQQVEVAIEAPGYLPFRDQLRTEAPGAPAQVLEVFLERAATATGITIRLHDVDAQPIPHVRAAVWRLPPAGERPGGALAEFDWHQAPPLWSRRASDPTGRYPLPQLEPGAYGVRLLATDEDGATRPLQPCVREFTLTGSNGFDEHVTLEPGCLLGIELLDSSYRALDPQQVALRMELRLAGGPATRRRWIHRAERGRLAADDAPPVAGLCWLEEPVAPGLYRLVVTVDGTRRGDFQLTLRAAERQQERLVVP